MAQNYFTQAAEAGNANAMAFLGKVTLSVLSDYSLFILAVM